MAALVLFKMSKEAVSGRPILSSGGNISAVTLTDLQARWVAAIALRLMCCCWQGHSCNINRRDGPAPRKSGRLAAEYSKGGQLSRICTNKPV